MLKLQGLDCAGIVCSDQCPRGLRKVAIVNCCLPVSEKSLTIAIEQSVTHAYAMPVVQKPAESLVTRVSVGDCLP